MQIGKQSHIHPAARLTGPVVIGDNCTVGENVKITGPSVIGDGCEIMPGAVIEESVVWKNVRIERNVNLMSSIVADNCCLNAGSLIEGAVLGDNVTVASGGILEPGSRIWPDETVQGKG